ncbi:conserved hypothetical protein [Ricinus communis]|uniref:Uncharacterized protein n=1 Tax=Ricinus communis TaxID=3988 RepID=B9TE19_RICCO|nr:conserved hypothetical protein [Ricinus communis]
MRANDLRAIGRLEAPVGNAAIGIEKTAMLLQICERARNAGLCEIGRRRDEHSAARRQLPGHKAGIGYRPVADDRVIAFRGRIDAAVIDIERQRYLRMLR